MAMTKPKVRMGTGPKQLEGSLRHRQHLKDQRAVVRDKHHNLEVENRQKAGAGRTKGGYTR